MELPGIMINGFEVAMELSIKIYYQRTFQWLLTCPICITVFDYLIEFVILLLGVKGNSQSTEVQKIL